MKNTRFLAMLLMATFLASGCGDAPAVRETEVTTETTDRAEASPDPLETERYPESGYPAGGGNALVDEGPQDAEPGNISPGSQRLRDTGVAEPLAPDTGSVSEGSVSLEAAVVPDGTVDLSSPDGPQPVAVSTDGSVAADSANAKTDGSLSAGTDSPSDGPGGDGAASLSPDGDTVAGGAGTAGNTADPETDGTSTGGDTNEDLIVGELPVSTGTDTDSDTDPDVIEENPEAASLRHDEYIVIECLSDSPVLIVGKDSSTFFSRKGIHEFDGYLICLETVRSVGASSPRSTFILNSLDASSKVIIKSLETVSLYNDDKLIKKMERSYGTDNEHLDYAVYDPVNGSLEMISKRTLDSMLEEIGS